MTDQHTRLTVVPNTKNFIKILHSSPKKKKPFSTINMIKFLFHITVTIKPNQYRLPSFQRNTDVQDTSLKNTKSTNYH